MRSAGEGVLVLVAPKRWGIPTTRCEFETGIAHLVTMAAARGVAVEGTWLVMSGTPDDSVDWTVEITAQSDDMTDR